MNIQAYYQNVRDAQQSALRRRKKEAYRLKPELEEVCGQINRLRMLTAVGQGKKEELEGLMARQRTLLAEINMPENALELWHHCMACKDTGLLPDGSYCSCYHRARLELCGLERRTFEDWDLGRFPEENGQRERSKKLLEFCRRYVEEYPQNPQKNLLLMGGTGAGKTFALTCVGFELARRGAKVRQTTGQEFFRLVMDRVIGQRDLEGLAYLEKIPVLLFDDLGAEPRGGGVVFDYVYGLLDKRILSGRHTVLTTNWTTDELVERYGYRLYSRLMDPGRTAVVKLSGRDLRLN